MKWNIGLTTLFTLSAFLFIPQVSSKVTNIIPAASAQTLAVGGGKCSNATISGFYVVELQGWIKEGTTNVPYASLGTYRANNGQLQGVQTVVIDGRPPFQQNVSATYQINSDCTGSAVSPEIGTFNIIVSEDGSRIPSISTNTGTTITGQSTRLYK